MSIKCLVCGKELIQLNDTYDVNNWSALYDGGNSWCIGCNHGSRYNNDSIIISLCDNCVEQKLSDGSIINDTPLDYSKPSIWD